LNYSKRRGGLGFSSTWSW